MILNLLGLAHSDQSGGVYVVGSINADVYVPVTRWPEDGENIVARESPISGVTLAGGKGAIQAVQASMLGYSKFIAQFGSDANGRMLKDTMAEYKPNLDLSLSRDNEKPSGCGLVFLKDSGGVSAIVIGAANTNWPEDFHVDDLFSSGSELPSAIMLQMEIPQWVNERVAKAAKDRGIPVFQDIGGAERSLEELGDHLSFCDYVSPNETELKRLTKMPVETDEEILEAALWLQAQGSKNVLVTLGAKGSMLLTADGKVMRQKCFPVEEVKDETGAGDNFRAAFVVSHIADGKSLADSLEYASASAALSVGKMGGIPSCTTRAECDEYLARYGVAGKFRGGSSGDPCLQKNKKEEDEEDDGDECPLEFASRLNSMKDREAVLSAESTGVEGWVLTQGRVNGLDLIDFNYPQHFTGPVSPLEKERFKNALQRAKMKCGAVCLRYPRAMQAGAMTNPDPALREEAVRLTMEACEWAEALGSSEVVVWSAFCGYDYPLQADYDCLWSRVKEAFQQVCDSYPHIKVSLEYKPTDENTRYFAVPSTAAAVLLVKEVDRENFGLTLDFGHCLMAGENPAQCVAMVHSSAGAGKLFGVQLGDGYGRLGAEDGLMFASVHPTMAFEFVLWLRKTGFHRHGGHVYFDTFPRNEDPVREAEFNIRAFKKLWHRAGLWLRDQADCRRYGTSRTPWACSRN